MRTNWEAIYEKYGVEEQLPHPMFARMVNLLDAHNCHRLMDLGCGTGRHLLPLAKCGYEIEGIDYSTKAIELLHDLLAQESCNANTNLRAADMHKVLEFYEEGSFDAILAFNSLHYSTPEEFKQSIELINKLLKTKGLFFATVPSTQSEINTEKDTEQITFGKEQILEILEQTFRILDFSMDDEHNFVITAYEQ